MNPRKPPRKVPITYSGPEDEEWTAADVSSLWDADFIHIMMAGEWARSCIAWGFSGSCTEWKRNRFADKVIKTESDRQIFLQALMQTYLATMSDIGVETWVMHGTLLGWWWNQKVGAHYPSSRNNGYQTKRPAILTTWPARSYPGTPTSTSSSPKRACNSSRNTTT